MAPILAYWKIRALVQPIRLMLEYAGVEFVDKKYEAGDAPDFDLSGWLTDKFSLGLDFPNLPYYIDGDLKITQTNAILRYLGRKHNLEAKTEEERIKQDMLTEYATDMKWAFIRMAYNLYKQGYEKLREDYMSNLPDEMKRISDFLGKRDWFIGNHLTYMDFVMYELLDQHKLYAPDCLNGFKNLQDFHSRFEALPAIKKYMESDRFMAHPVNNKMAVWIG